MASDIVLVLRSEHRELQVLAEQCRRPSRGLQRPEEGLRRRLAAHADALHEVVSWGITIAGNPEFVAVLSSVAGEVENPSREGLAECAGALVEVEVARVVPRLLALPIEDRRRMGKVFRIHRDRSLRHTVPAVRRQRSQTELYELARRAGLEQRSRMSQSQLEEAVSAWERAQTPRWGTGPSAGG